MRHCKDCEPAQEIHWLAYTSVVLGMVSQPYFNMMESLFKRPSERLSRWLSLPFMRSMVALGLAYFADEPDAKDNWRTKCFWEEAKKRGIKMREFHMGPVRDIFTAEYGGKIITFDGLPRPGGKDSDSLKWMDDKRIMKKKFLKVGLPVARGGAAWSGRGALKIFSGVDKPVITKPNLGSRSRHTTIHIDSPEGVLAGFKKANQLSPLVMVEEELRGSLFRGTLVGGRLAGVVRRDPPQVVGDGVHTLRELWEEENKRPERVNGPIFHPIVYDADAEKELARQNITMDDVPERGRVISFSQKTSRGVGGSTTEVSADVHPENIKMLENLAAFLDDSLIGADFIMEDIGKSWRDQPLSGVIECNSMPFIDLHHYVLFGQPNNIAAKLWDIVLPETKK
ncbi:MAG TPA: hypothetical protein VG694_02295 [Candidatus Paceibacterota bacterium]|nr:hypothetical protein [Candidatus Paceibacterota bacterium]